MTNINNFILWWHNFYRLHFSQVHNFWAPTEVTGVDSKRYEFPLPQNKDKQHYNFINSDGLHYEAEEVRKCIFNGKLESDYASHSDSLTIANISDEIRRKIGVHYPEDDQEY